MDSLGLIRIEKTQFGFFESFPAGVHLAVEKLRSYVDQFKKILSPKTEAYKGVGGFKAMGSIFPSMWDWQSFWTITAFFSIALAFFNILPIPALDGGHVLFTVLEMITGRKPSQKLLEYAQVVGMVVLLALMIYVNGNDWFGWGKGQVSVKRKARSYGSMGVTFTEVMWSMQPFCHDLLSYIEVKRFMKKILLFSYSFRFFFPVKKIQSPASSNEAPELTYMILHRRYLDLIF